MTRTALLLCGLVHYRWTNAAVLLGAAIASAVLVGALIIGDSVRHSLRWLVTARLGRAEFALVTGERFAQTRLARDLALDLEIDTAPVLLLEGVATAEGGRRRANRVQVVGVDRSFWAMGAAADGFGEEDASLAAVNRHLADRLGIESGDDVVVRIERHDRIPGDLPHRSRARNSIALRTSVAKIVEDGGFGRFSLHAQQSAPLTVFLPLSRLGQELGLEDRCNVILVSNRSEATLSGDELRQTLIRRWQLADVGLKLRDLSSGGAELISERIFLSPEVARGAMCADATVEAVSTYFVNSISFEERTTPYSFVAAIESPAATARMGLAEIVVNQWLADDLGARVGDVIELSYFVPDEGSRLVEHAARFRIAQIVPVDARHRNLMPELPGFADAQSCNDWDSSLPIDLDRVRDKDESYWETHGGTPKAFVRLAAAQRLWGNRFGELTAVRYPGPEKSVKDLEAAILRDLVPESLGLIFQPVLREGLDAADQAVDFGQLFLGLSFFIVVGALLLTGLMFVLSVESRSREAGMLRAVGMSTGEVSQLQLIEGSLVAALGAVLGTLGGVVLAVASLTALRSVWSGAVGSAVLLVDLQPVTLVIGAALGFALALASMAIAQRSSASRSVCELLRGETTSLRRERETRPRLGAVLASLSATGALLIVAVFGVSGGREATAAFWSAGGLMLLATLIASHSWLGKADTSRLARRPTLGSLALAEVARKRRRSTVAIALLACGVFIVVAVAANRKSALVDDDVRSSGTGGFAFYGETALPIEEDLDSPLSRRRLRLPEQDVSFVQMKRRAGDDASCLNLNRTSRPTVLGVPVEELADRGAFSFARVAEDIDSSDPWAALEAATCDGVVPAVADQAVLTWGLGLEVGDHLTIQDEGGNEVSLRLVGGLASSVFQGNVLISRSDFSRLFPSSVGSQVLLVDAPSARRDEVREAIGNGLMDWGLDLQPATDRLASFMVVENTYLSIFLALGGLGLIIGMSGIGVVLLRDVLGRRAELAALRAIGFRRSSIRKMLTMEYGILMVVGLLGGTVAALVAVLPSLLAPGSSTPWLALGLALTAIAASGLIWLFGAMRVALRGDLLPALRND